MSAIDLHFDSSATAASTVPGMAVTWYHASHAELPPGTELAAPPGSSGVFLSRDLDTAHDWAHLLGAQHVYRVQPNGKPRARHQKDALGDWEWIADVATVVALAGTVHLVDEYCDGCLVRDMSLQVAPRSDRAARGR